jgi:hypothetical protein
LKGSAQSGRRQLSYNKSLWKRRTKKAFKDVDILLRKGRIGELISMGDLWEAGHNLVKMGSAVIPILESIARLHMSEAMRRDVQHFSQLIEVYSEALVTLAKRLDMPTHTFPYYESKVEPVTAVASPEPKSLDEILRG